MDGRKRKIISHKL